MSRRSTIRRLIMRLGFATAVVAACAPGVRGQGLPFHGPSGSATGGVEEVSGRGAGVLFRAGHVAGDTIGRNDSISHIGGMPFLTIGGGDTLLFGDARLVRSNEGQLAWSFGAGWRRYFADVDAVLGLNSYFDRDQLTGSHFKQYGLGVELLSHNWEWRGNFYKPFGETNAQTNLAAVPDSAVFVGNEVQFSQIRSFASALEGFDTEVGFLLPGRFAEDHQIRAFGGAYLYRTEGDDIRGWKAKVQGNVFDWMEMNLQVSNDQVFDTNVIFGVALNVGGYKECGPITNSRYRLGEPVRRNFNIVAANIDVTEAGVTAVNADNGLAFDITHVNSNAPPGGDGTVEFPYQTIPQGQADGGDIIFVHADSVFNGAPDNAIVMNNGERILGEGLTTTHTIDIEGIGEVPLGPSPAFGAGVSRPLLSNSAGPTVTMANSTEFSGFIIDASNSHGILAENVEDITANENLISDATGEGIRIVNPTGDYVFRDTVISNATGAAFNVEGGDADIVFAQSADDDPGLGRIVNSSDFAVRVQNTTGGSVVFNTATIDDTGGAGISIENAAGNVTIDNATIVNSTGNGINIQGGSGRFTFRSTLRGVTRIDNSALEAINIDGMEEAGEVIFIEPVQVDNRNSSAFRFNNISGTVSIRGDVLVSAQGAATDPAISFTNNSATSEVIFRSNITVADSAGFGIRIANNAGDATERATFEVSGTSTFNNVADDNISIENDASMISFGESRTDTGGVTVDGRGDNGIAINGATGDIGFHGLTTIDNSGGVAAEGIDIRNSQARIDFNRVSVQNATGQPAVNLIDNQEGALGNANITFQDLLIGSNNGDGLFGSNNTAVRIFDGEITSVTGTAVDFSDSGMAMRFRQVSSSGADHGIQLSNTTGYLGSVDSVFEVVPLTPQAGGVIETATVAGGQFFNAGIIRLNGMFFDDNEIGIDIEYDGLPAEPTGLLRLEEMTFDENNVHAIRGLNVPLLDVTTSRFDDNGDDNADGRETVLLTYDERVNDDTTPPDDIFEYRVTAINNFFSSDNDDIFDIRAGLNLEGHMRLLIESNEFVINDLEDFDAADDDDDAFRIIWDGELFGDFQDNQFRLLAANNDSQVGLRIVNENDDLFTELGIRENGWDIRNSVAETARDTGLIIELDGESEMAIARNAIEMRGTNNTGMFFELNDRTSAFVADNVINHQLVVTARNDVGMQFDRVSGNSILTIVGNEIDLRSPLFTSDVGIEIRSTGVFTLNRFRTDGGAVNNLIAVGPATVFPFTDEFRVFGASNGQILVNGTLLPLIP